MVYKATISELKLMHIDDHSNEKIHFIDSASMYNGRDGSKRFAMLKFGGVVRGFCVFLALRVFYSGKGDCTPELDRFANLVLDDIKVMAQKALVPILGELE